MRCLTLLLVAACSTPSVTTHVAPPVANDRSARITIPPVLPYELARPRPTFDLAGLLPDPARHGRWPLTLGEHPALEPSFDVAGALAQPGIGWVELCHRGAQRRNLGSRQDLSRYLEAWCLVERHDTSGALDQLGRLHGSTVIGLAAAARRDGANILAGHGPSDDVERLLRASAMLEPEVLDRTAAAYFDAGQLADAYAVNQLVLGLDHQASDELRCHRLARGAADAPAEHVDDLVSELDELAQSSPDPSCHALAHELSCWRAPATKCKPYFKDQQRPLAALALFEAVEAWPAGEAGFERWARVGLRAVDARPVSDALRIGVPALEVAIRVSRCDREDLKIVSSLIGDLQLHVDEPVADRGLVDRLRALDHQIVLLTHEPQQCREHLAALPPVGP
jgi:hypothetical protein